MQKVFSEDEMYLNIQHLYLKHEQFQMRGVTSWTNFHPWPGPLSCLRQRPPKALPAVGLSQQMETSSFSFWTLFLPPNGWPASGGPGDLGG